MQMWGWVEVRPLLSDPASSRPDKNWSAVIDAGGGLLFGNYHAYGCLFGVANSDFEPLAPGRGIPEDASERVRQDLAAWDTDAFSPSWVTWAEIKAMDWEEEAADGESRRKDAFDSRDWQALFGMMEALAGPGGYGDQGVRLVVWFTWGVW